MAKPAEARDISGRIIELPKPSKATLSSLGFHIQTYLLRCVTTRFGNDIRNSIQICQVTIRIKDAHVDSIVQLKAKPDFGADGRKFGGEVNKLSTESESGDVMPINWNVSVCTWIHVYL